MQLAVRVTQPTPIPPRLARAMRVMAFLIPISIALFVAIGLIFSGDPGKMFGEGKPGTILSVMLLGIAGVSSLQLWHRLKPLPQARIWLVMGVVFVTTSLDDMFKLHENLDDTLAARFGYDPEGPLDAIDDILVALYILPAMYLVARGWRQLLRLRWCVRLFSAAFVFFAVMVLIDMFEAHHTAEESIKLIAGALIFLAVVAGRQDPFTFRLLDRATAERAEEARNESDAGSSSNA